ncbi:MAG: amidohydrolase family protein [Armatimonadota bacterium]
MHIIDVNTSFGKRVDPDPRFTPAALCDELGRHKVARAFAFSQKGLHYSSFYGNAEALQVTRQYPALLPVATLNPRESLGWQEEMNRVLRAGVKILRFFPGQQGWSITSARFREILDYLHGSGIALMVSTTECPTGWELAIQIAEMTANLEMPVILTDSGYGNMTESIAVMQKYPHVYADTRWLAAMDAVEIMAEAVGADRLLYSSMAPLLPMQKALNQVLEAHLSDGDKIAILGGNAMRLFDIAPEELAGAPRLDSLEPKKFDEEIIDVHSHLGYWALPLRNEDYDPAQMLARMRRFGITRSILSSYESMRYDLAAGNRAVAQAIEGHPELLGYVELDPHHLELSCAEMDRYYPLPNFAGCEIELTHIPCPTGSPKVRALFAEMAKRGKPVLFMPHSEADAEAERALGREFPNLNIIHAHSFDAEWAQVVQDTPNIHVEHCYSRGSHFPVIDTLRILGPERVLFGSDQTLLSVGAAVGMYLDAGMTAEARTLVLAGNARRIFGI